MTQLKNLLFICLIAKCMATSNYEFPNGLATADQVRDQTGAYDRSLTQKGMYNPNLNHAGKYHPDVYNKDSSVSDSDSQDNQEDEDNAIESEVADQGVNTLDSGSKDIKDSEDNDVESRSSQGGLEESDNPEGDYVTNNNDNNGGGGGLDDPHTETITDDTKSADALDSISDDNDTSTDDENSNAAFAKDNTNITEDDNKADIAEDDGNATDDSNKSRKKRDASTGYDNNRSKSINDGKYRPDPRNDGKYRPDSQNDGRYRPNSGYDVRSRPDTQNNVRSRPDAMNNSRPRDTYNDRGNGIDTNINSKRNRSTPKNSSKNHSSPIGEVNSTKSSSNKSNKRNKSGDAKCLNDKPDKEYLGMVDYCKSKDRDGTDVNQELMVKLVNELRRTHPVKYDPELAKIAQAQSDDMVRCQIFDHDIIPDELKQRREKRTKFGKLRTFENIGFNCNEDSSNPHLDTHALTKKAFKNWKNSPGHRDNMLIDALTHIGVARRGNLWTMSISRRDDAVYIPEFKFLKVRKLYSSQ